MYLLGTSGFASPTLREHLPAPTGAAMDLLTAYASRFPAVEMDSAFSRPPSPQTIDAWRKATPDSFSFVVRVPREITHTDGLSDTGGLQELVETLTGLEGRLHALLFSLPPSMDCEPERISYALDALPPGLRTIWEFRHPSWICPEVLDLLAERHGAPAVVENLDGVSGEQFLPGGDLDGKWDLSCFYVRFRREVYSIADLMHWGGLLGGVAARGRDVCAFFRPSAEATSYVLALSELLEEGSSP